MRTHHDHDVLPRVYQATRRRFIRDAGILGAALAACGLIPGQSSRGASYQWLAGDHHIHTQFSVDAQYTVAQQVDQASAHAIDWMVITDHGRVAHEAVGAEKTFAAVTAARTRNPGMLLYQGLEWNIPGAEHGTVFLAPGKDEIALLREFERSFDGVVVFGEKATQDDPAIQAKAAEGIGWLAAQVKADRTAAALFLANHPARRGLDSPGEIRMWNDADSGIAVGMEGAPGHQAAGIGKVFGGPELARGFYDFKPTPDSHPDYPLESYRTFGGYDWMTAKVGGLWDSLLSEGRRWWITANSDAHTVYRDTFVRGAGSGKYDDPASPNYGNYGNPVDSEVAQNGAGDLWPGSYSRTVVGAAERSYLGVMRGIREGRMWVTHGDLVAAVDARLDAPNSPSGSGLTLGGTVTVKKGDDLELVLTIQPARRVNWNGDLPELRRVDLIAGPITGPASNPQTFSAPETAVIKSFEVSGTGQVVLRHRFARIAGPFYVRIRGTDGRATATGSIEPRLDPVPIDPWSDLWFYTNPIFVTVT